MCRECDRLRAENRELREELEEWRNGPLMSEDGQIYVMAKKLKSNRQVCLLIKSLLDAENRVVDMYYLSELIGYNGRDEEFANKDGFIESDRLHHLRVIVSKARSSLKQIGVSDAIVNARRVGYMMTKQKAAEVRAVVGIEK